MSRHEPRSRRWSRLGPNEYRSATAVVRYDCGAWWAFVTYEERAEEEPETQMPWQGHADRIGPFKRPRNAMMAAEERVLLLQRRAGDRMRFGPT